ncbi:tRNA (adenosine(37)-N6)-threonylcarbamoyltransferase complex ATPase subunit type 1 TsaE [Lactobacillaceae bacterium L1_55_11]|nr:tRNA (adenosine(37)-N6)-threonylcarbamoyltransferase complex ATPase subunit type 1 TsaE [Lactobacillaceae bacterium L1_55_11]
MKTFTTQGPAATQELAQKVAHLAKPGLIITLRGDLGAGKTTFTQGFAKALGVKGRIKSPTFNILNIYQGDVFPIYHFDAYRLADIGAEDQGFEDYIGTDGVTLIEWPQYMADLLPQDYLAIDFQRQDRGGDDFRQIEVTGHGSAVTLEAAL